MDLFLIYIICAEALVSALILLWLLKSTPLLSCWLLCVLNLCTLSIASQTLLSEASENFLSVATWIQTLATLLVIMEGIRLKAVYKMNWISEKIQQQKANIQTTSILVAISTLIFQLINWLYR